MKTILLILLFLIPSLALAQDTKISAMSTNAPGPNDKTVWSTPGVGNFSDTYQNLTNQILQGMASQSYASGITNGLVGLGTLNSSSNSIVGQFPNTNGFVTSGITNGLAGIGTVNSASNSIIAQFPNTNGFVTATVTNGLAGMGTLNSASNFLYSAIGSGGTQNQFGITTNWMTTNASVVVSWFSNVVDTSFGYIDSDGNYYYTNALYTNSWRQYTNGVLYVSGSFVGNLTGQASTVTSISGNTLTRTQVTNALTGTITNNTTGTASSATTAGSATNVAAGGGATNNAGSGLVLEASTNAWAVYSNGVLVAYMHTNGTLVTASKISVGGASVGSDALNVTGTIKSSGAITTSGDSSMGNSITTSYVIGTQQVDIGTGSNTRMSSTSPGQLVLMNGNNAPMTSMAFGLTVASPSMTFSTNSNGGVVAFSGTGSFTNGFGVLKTNAAPSNVTIGVTSPDYCICSTNTAGLQMFTPAWINH